MLARSYGICAPVYHCSNSTILFIISPVFGPCRTPSHQSDFQATEGGREEEEGGGRWLKIAPLSFEAASHLVAPSLR